MTEDVFDYYIDALAKLEATMLPGIAIHHGVDPQTTDVVEWWRGKSIYDDDDGGRPDLDHLPSDGCLFDCERAILGCLLVNGEALRMVDDLLESETFLWPGHGRLYRRIRDLIRAGKRRSLAKLGVHSQKQIEYLRGLICGDLTIGSYGAATIVNIRLWAEIVAGAAIEYSTP